MKSPHVLVVEDNPMVREFIREVLQDDGIEVTEADCLAAARRAIPGSTAGALILDYMLPDGKAVDVWSFAMQTNDVLAKKTLVISGALDQATLEELRRVLNARVLAKPFQTDELLAAVRELLD